VLLYVSPLLHRNAEFKEKYGYRGDISTGEGVQGPSAKVITQAFSWFV
jgi:hypothetical protein